jgi:hypothetical protein
VDGGLTVEVERTQGNAAGTVSAGQDFCLPQFSLSSIMTEQALRNVYGMAGFERALERNWWEAVRQSLSTLAITVNRELDQVLLEISLTCTTSQAR